MTRVPNRVTPAKQGTRGSRVVWLCRLDQSLGLN